MTRVGSSITAQRAIDFVRNPPTGGLYGYEDETWKVLGNSCRTVLLHRRSKVVYKVDKPNDYFDQNDNLVEYATARELIAESGGTLRLGSFIRLPKVTGYKVTDASDAGKTLVLAMEFVEGTLGSDIGYDSYRSHRKELHEIGRMADMHGMNWLIDHSGDIVPIDLGSHRREDLDLADRRVLSDW